MEECQHDGGWLLVVMNTSTGERPIEVCRKCRAMFAPELVDENKDPYEDAIKRKLWASLSTRNRIKERE
jgi:hypothetical protein